MIRNEFWRKVLQKIRKVTDFIADVSYYIMYGYEVIVDIYEKATETFEKEARGEDADYWWIDQYFMDAEEYYLALFERMVEQGEINLIRTPKDPHVIPVNRIMNQIYYSKDNPDGFLIKDIIYFRPAVTMVDINFTVDTSDPYRMFGIPPCAYTY